MGTLVSEHGEGRYELAAEKERGGGDWWQYNKDNELTLR
ncbi:hypothetical protein R69776_01683 [Paraburkholderia nemoris]|uniref:Uncharacterized protein n=1 Tax=Paraburkholderia nemoris TaxID=2793076 RepID=A0ABM8QZ68_9BURK|nr:hypothetical protein R69776_01683 [Paraburkholderia nemoris]CAE6748786.1 hypothetical protein R75777_02887 [Paraburkholderia nemoris]